MGCDDATRPSPSCLERRVGRIKWTHNVLQSMYPGKIGISRVTALWNTHGVLFIYII